MKNVPHIPKYMVDNLVLDNVFAWRIFFSEFTGARILREKFGYKWQDGTGQFDKFLQHLEDTNQLTPFYFYFKKFMGI